MIDITCSIVLLLVLPALLVFRVFRSQSSTRKKWLLVPVCFIAPNVLYFLWPVILTSAGFLKATGDATFWQTVRVWSSLGGAGTIIWTVLTVIVVAIYFYVTNPGSETDV
jgi:membrane protein CcdC involved in cytochrome C biogenesis